MSASVLVVDDDDAVRAIIVAALEDAGYACSEARDGREAVHLARERLPDLVVLDIVMPELSGDEVLRILRHDQRTRYTPVIFVTAQGTSRDKATRLLGGADDYIAKPFSIEELVARVAAVLRRSTELRALNPLSGLPGNVAIATEISRHLASDDGASCMYCDLDHFKEFNDHYGFARGDELIVRLARLLLEIATRRGDVFVGHVGGDDFVLILPESEAADVAREIVREFDALAPSLYDPADRERGGIVRVDRRGVERRLPFVTLSLGIVSIAASRFPDSVAVSRAAAEVKEIAKRRDESSWAMDRRRAPERATADTLSNER
ncbi:MAG TPA: response regulator [Candidatus Limnocylindria bacterium]|nr:response regulator [Candidatus Limnocylindria bacterium]